MKALFLACALAVEPTMFHHNRITVDDIRVIQKLRDVDDMGKFHDRGMARMLLIGSPAYWVDLMQKLGIRTWRVTVHKQTARDIIASVMQLPFKEDGFRMVIYSLSGGSRHWESMHALSEAIWPLTENGYFFFQPTRCPLFRKYLLKLHYERLPFVWDGYEIYQKRIPSGRKILEWQSA